MSSGGEEQKCEVCDAPATKERSGGFEWHPICDACAEWWPESRLRPITDATQPRENTHG